MNTQAQQETNWTATDVSHPVFSGDIEFQDVKGKWQHFVVIATKEY